MLTLYNKKRNFDETPEPAGTKSGAVKHRFVVQRHEASRLHFDFRLELNGVLKSWALPKGPSLNSADKRFAIQVEDHPVSYVSFSGVIPEGNYGAGRMEIWDKGVYTPVDEKGSALTDRQATAWLKKGQLKFTLKGKKLNGGFALVQLKDDPRNWLLIKHKDNFSVTQPYDPDQGRLVEKTKKRAVRPITTKKRVDTKQASVNTDSSLITAGTKDLSLKVNSHTLKLTNLNKLYWPDDKITKGALINYYNSIAPIILPYLKNRPMSLKRNINGIMDKGFFQKDAGEHFADWIKKAPFLAPSTNKTVNYTLCNDKATLLYLANLGCIEMNPWNSTVQSPNNPSYLIMDIDPSAKNTFEQVIETVQVICQLLEKAGATFYCKTSGATGMHIFVPLNARYSYELTRHFGEIIATLAQEQLPEFTSLERSLKKRGDKIYIDYQQNSKGQTIAAAYSVRPVAGAQVSAPVTVKEIRKGLHPSQFTIFNIEKRIRDLGDVFFMALKKGIDMQRCLKKLGY